MMTTNRTPLSEQTTLTLDSTANLLNAIAVTVLIVLASVLILVFVLSSLRRRRVERLGQRPQEELKQWRADLVEQVGVASQTQRAHISLRELWRGSGLSGAQKYVVLKELIDRQVFYPAYSIDRLVAFFQNVSWNFLHHPVAFERLSDQKWQRLASGESAGIVANGDVILVRDSPGAGVVSRSRAVNQTITQELTPALVQDLAQSLRQDARALYRGHPLREQAESFADTLERDVAANRWESVKKTASDVLKFAASGAGLWAATLTILGGN